MTDFTKRKMKKLPMTPTERKNKSLQKAMAAGAKQVNVVLDAETVKKLDDLLWTLPRLNRKTLIRHLIHEGHEKYCQQDGGHLNNAGDPGQ